MGTSRLLYRGTLGDEAMTQRAGFFLAARLRVGDVVALDGAVGTGKSVFARALIRARFGEAGPIPSPGFALVQEYGGAGERLLHADLYRLVYAQEMRELGLWEDADAMVVLEWARRAPDDVPRTHLRVQLQFARAEGARRLQIYGDAAWARRLHGLAQFLTRQRALGRFVRRHGWGEAHLSPVRGDASERRFERLLATDKGERRAILMDWPYAEQPAAARRYARATALADDPAAFGAMAQFLCAEGIAAPQIFAADYARGFVLMEDLGARGLAGAHACAAPFLRPAYLEAVEVLLHLRRGAPSQLPLARRPWRLPRTTAKILHEELHVFLQWYAPHVGRTVSPALQRSWRAVWAGVMPLMLDDGEALVLRDYHSPNLLWRAEHQTWARLGVIDVQDGILGHAAYDLVSLLQDARVTLGAREERFWLRHYLREVKRREGACDAAAFRRSYAALGAQRACRIAGIFVRLAQRDKKPHYLAHLPRVLAYLRRNLKAEGLEELASWFARHFPELAA
ncbi:MAG: tRNA (adenosine(37)-N6)-threonylcarbamoyltransferase complex ATPase subunit type 1 TsaE [Hyphomicrobiales bacterium]|nr:tRNA (adenosine(37)-N6)-threonylcarbamoyltransferase complex ATPase subunit type 1 TsaE [Hyphomicrobiales bacterium]